VTEPLRTKSQCNPFCILFQIDHIDAVYERPDHRIVFFIGRNIFILNGNALLDSGPIPLTRIGLPDSVEKVDGAFRWGWNGKTYIFSGSVSNHTTKKTEIKFLLSISCWLFPAVATMCKGLYGLAKLLEVSRHKNACLTCLDP
jgi:Hemopexin